MVDTSGPSSVTKHRKRRNPNSCDVCKRKKVKCDSSLMPDNRCTECISQGCECIRSGSKRYTNWRPSVVYPNSGSRLNPACPAEECRAGFSRASSSASSQVHPLVSVAVALLPKEASPALNGALVNISSHLFRLERLVSQLPTPIAPKPIGHNNATAGEDFPEPASNDEAQNEERDNDNELAQLTEQFTDMHFKTGHGRGERHFGPSSTLSLLGMALKVILESNKDPTIVQSFRGIRRPLYWSTLPWETELHEDPIIFEFPPAPLLFELIEIYFHEINVSLPLLHKGIFLKAVEENQHIVSPDFGEVVLGVCSCAARWCQDPSVLLEADGVGHSAGWRWFRQIRIFRKLMSSTPSVYDLQSIMLSVIYLHGSSQVEISWTLIGVGMRFAVELGAHRKRTLSTMDSELWKRAFWLLWVYDGIMSTHTGRCRSVPSDEFDVDLPIECDDEFWYPEDPEQAFRQPPGRPSTISGFISLIRYIRVLDKAQDQLFSVKASKAISSGQVDAPRIVAELELELERWYQTIPDHLNWDKFQTFDDKTFRQLTGTPRIFFKQAAVLECAYHHTRMLVHRPFIFFSKPESPMFTTSWLTCVSSAKACIEIFKVTQPFLIVHVGMLGTATILILEKWKVGVRSEPLEESVGVCLKAVTAAENRWYSAGRLADLIRELMHLDDLVSHSTLNVTPEGPSSSDQDSESREPHVFNMTTRAWPWPTYDMNFLSCDTSLEDDPLAMLF